MLRCRNGKRYQPKCELNSKTWQQDRLNPWKNIVKVNEVQRNKRQGKRNIMSRIEAEKVGDRKEEEKRV